MKLKLERVMIAGAPTSRIVSAGLNELPLAVSSMVIVTALALSCQVGTAAVTSWAAPTGRPAVLISAITGTGCVGIEPVTTTVPAMPITEAPFALTPVILKVPGMIGTMNRSTLLPAATKISLKRRGLSWAPESVL